MNDTVEDREDRFPKIAQIIILLGESVVDDAAVFLSLR